VIVNQEEARRILARHYGARPIKLTTKCLIGVRAVAEINRGLPVLAWRKVQPGPVSSVQIGRVLPSGEVDWHWTEDTNDFRQAAP
jgi:hypothetical protein